MITAKMSVIAPQKFGFTVGGAFGLLGAALLWKHGGQAVSGWVLLGVGGFLVLSALVRASWLPAIERVWMAVAHVMGEVMTRVLLTLVFVFVLTPLGVLKRLFTREEEAETDSYWNRRDEPFGSMERPY